MLPTSEGKHHSSFVVLTNGKLGVMDLGFLEAIARIKQFSDCFINRLMASHTDAQSKNSRSEDDACSWTS